MLYAVLCYNDEEITGSWTKAEDDRVMARLKMVTDKLEAAGKLGHELGNYFYFFGVKGALLEQLGRNEEARVAFDRAIALAHTPSD